MPRVLGRALEWKVQYKWKQPKKMRVQDCAYPNDGCSLVNPLEG